MITAFYVPPSSGIPVGRIVRRACLAKNVQLKEAALTMGVDMATLSRGIHGLAPLDLHRLVLLPDKVLRRVFRLILAAKLAQWETDVIENRKIS